MPEGTPVGLESTHYDVLEMCHWLWSKFERSSLLLYCLHDHYFEALHFVWCLLQTHSVLLYCLNHYVFICSDFVVKHELQCQPIVFHCCRHNTSRTLQLVRRLFERHAIARYRLSHNFFVSLELIGSELQRQTVVLDCFKNNIFDIP